MGIKAQLITVAVLMALAGVIFYFATMGSTREGIGSGVVCTMEAKLCPDGSYVGRTGPKCEFTPCPAEALCEGGPCPATVPVPVSTGTLAIGDRATMGGTTIGILELAEDSRCPADVQCIWAGTVRVRAAIDALSRDFTFTLGESQTVGNANITLISVIPAQKFSTQTVALNDYRFTFSVVPKATSGVVTPANNSGISGTVMLGPTCPVMRDPPDPQCADKPYETQISVARANGAVVATTKSDAQGNFEVLLSPGDYTVSATGGRTLPSCSPVSVTVSANNYATASVECDTGIR